MDTYMWCALAVLAALAVTVALPYVRYATAVLQMTRMVKQSEQLTEYMRSVLEAQQGSPLSPDEVEKLRYQAADIVAKTHRSGKKFDLRNVRMVTAATEEEAERKLQELCEKEKRDGR